MSFEQQLDHLAVRARSACRRGHVMSFLLDLKASVGGGDGQAYAMHAHNIGQVIADVGHLMLFEAGVTEDLVEDRNLLDMTLIDVGHPYLLGALYRGR